MGLKIQKIRKKSMNARLATTVALNISFDNISSRETAYWEKRKTQSDVKNEITIGLI
jgi:hypothetical protein